MEVKGTDTFLKSFKRMIDSENPLKWVYWEHKWYDFKWSIRNLIKYFRIVTKMRPWGYNGALEMLQFQLQILHNKMKENSMEIEEDLNPKLEKMERSIKLINHQLKDDFAERCGYDHNIGFSFEDDGEGVYSFISKGTPEQEEKNSKALKNGHELEEKEWNELFRHLKDMRSWWY